MASIVHVDATNEPRFSEVAWASTGLDQGLVQRIRATGTGDVPVTVLTKVQKHVLEADPSANIYANAATGSGKTLAFLAPILRDMAQGKADGALLLSPTNPLRLQHIRVGESIAPPIARVLRIESRAAARSLLQATGPVLSVSTPSKWLAIVSTRPDNARSYAASRLSVIVLDEVDEMVRNPGFFKEIQEVIAASPTARIIAMTATSSLRALEFVKTAASANGHGLVHIDAGDATKAKNHVHDVIAVDAEMMLPALAAIVKREVADGHKVLIFFATVFFADFAHSWLTSRGVSKLHLLHSKMASGAAARAEAQFRACTSCAMLCSNVLARGMDIPDVDVVVQVGSSKPETYAQRVGRSGRAGRAGRGVLLVTREEVGPMLTSLKSEEIVPTKRDAPTDPIGREGTGSPEMPSRLQGDGRRAFKSLLGAYKTDVRMLKWTMRDAVDVVKRIFQGVGVSAPSVPANNKIGIKEGDGLVIDGTAHNNAGKRRAKGGSQGGSQGGSAMKAGQYAASSIVVVSAAVAISVAIMHG